MHIISLCKLEFVPCLMTQTYSEALIWLIFEANLGYKMRIMRNLVVKQLDRPIKILYIHYYPYMRWYSVSDARLYLKVSWVFNRLQGCQVFVRV
jgi:hypothetical protein